MAEARKKLKVEDARALFTNFEGREDKYNRKGNRNFMVTLDTEFAEELAAEGWNVKWLNSREDEEPQAILNMVVNFGGARPPKVVMVTSRGKTPLTEENIVLLDGSVIQSVDVIANRYDWETATGSGIKPYVDTLFAVIEENELDLKYADHEEAA